MEENIREEEILKLGNELALRRYYFYKTQASHFLNESDYMILYVIKQTGDEQEIYAGKTYLKDISERMQLSIRQTSRIIGKLKDRGLVKWSHDGDGDEGTYITVTDEGEKLLVEQQVLFKEYYGRVIERFGRDNLIELLNLMKQLETVMYSEQEKMEVDDNADGGDE